MKKIIFLLSITCLFANQMQVDGSLKVTGQIDASNYQIKNVGPPTDMFDAVNAQTLQDVLRNDGTYEYDYALVKFGGARHAGSMTFETWYKKLGDYSWTSNFDLHLNQLQQLGWQVSARIDTPSYDSGETLMVIYELKRSIDE